MLIEFKIRNFRSFQGEQTLSMVAGPGTELSQNTFVADIGGQPRSPNKFRLVNAAVVYGPNAGGKSNLIRAFSFMRGLVLNSAKESQQGETIPVINFIFDAKSREEPSVFEVVFIKNKIRYQYGFIVDKNHILEESLIAYPEGRPQHWFTRKYNPSHNKSEEYIWKFSKHFKPEKQIANLTIKNVLFLSNAVKLNNAQLLPVFSWFQKDLVILSAAQEISLHKSIAKMNVVEDKKRIMQYLNIADPSISDISLTFKKFSEEDFPKNISQEFKELIKKDLLDKSMTKIDFIHGENTLLNSSQESEGTQKFFGLAGYWMDVLDQGQVIIIDELENSLHTLVVKFLISLFCNPEINKKNAQLIFSTHNTTLLDNELFRRDQIWFVEKDQKNSTQLYSLLDFSPRKQESISKGYLQGRYGALPYIGHWRF